MRFLNKLEELPLNSRVCLYGTGEGGRSFKKHLKRRRKDVEVVCFADDFRMGKYEGIEIINLEKLQNWKANFDIFLITSAYWRDMYKKLEDSSIRNYMVVNPFLIFENHIFTEEEEDVYRVYFKDVDRLLSYERDKRLYWYIIESRNIRQDKHELYAYFKYDNAEEKEYTEFINQVCINTIIEGGVLDGQNTIEFLHFLPKDGMIYGFEPFYQAYFDSRNRAYLEKFPNVKVFPLALWERRGKIGFLENRDNNPASKVIMDKKIKGKRKYVDAISIDEFVKEQAIEKIDFIKLDVEASELSVLKGAVKTLREHRPQLAVSIYHSKEHLFKIPLFLDNILDNYRYRIGHYSSTFWDTVWYAIPEEVCA